MNQPYNQSPQAPRPTVPPVAGASYLEDPQHFAHELTQEPTPMPSIAPHNQPMAMPGIVPVMPAAQSNATVLNVVQAQGVNAQASYAAPMLGGQVNAPQPSSPQPLAPLAPVVPNRYEGEVVELKAEPITNQIIGMRKSICMQANSFDELWEQAHRLSFCSIMPMSIRSTATVDHTGDVFVLLQKALRYGLDVMDAVRAFYVMPQPGGAGISFYVSVPFKRAICKRYGSISVTIDKATCVATAHGRRFDTGEEMSESFGAEEAALRGQMALNPQGFWEGKPKSSWEKHWPEMLKNRALGKLLDALFPDVVFGLATLEEALDEEVFEREYLAQRAQFTHELNGGALSHDNALLDSSALETPDIATCMGAAAFRNPSEESIQERVSRKVTQSRRGKGVTKPTETDNAANPQATPYPALVPPMPALNHEPSVVAPASDNAPAFLSSAPNQEQNAPTMSAKPWSGMINPLDAPHLDSRDGGRLNATPGNAVSNKTNPTV